MEKPAVYITPEQINKAIDKLIAGCPFGTCIGYLDLRIQAMLKLKDNGIRGDLLTAAMKQFGRLN